MLSVSFFIAMLTVVMLSVVILSVVAPLAMHGMNPQMGVP